jgi:hypothetical protein
LCDVAPALTPALAVLAPLARFAAGPNDTLEEKPPLFSVLNRFAVGKVPTPSI